MIAVIDYDMGNVGSIVNMIKKVGGQSTITRDLSVIESASKIILPGVGTFDTGVQNIINFGLKDILDYKALKQKVPTLGICLGMQLLGLSSEEGKLPGFGWIKAKTVKLNATNKLKIPHMGWNEAKPMRDSILLKDLPMPARFYFVHSYHLVCDSQDDCLTTTTYGSDFTSSVQNHNIFGTQFHPEKSHRYGMQLLSNFVNKI